VFSVTLIDDAANPPSEVVVLSNIKLAGDSQFQRNIEPTIATRIKISMAEGGIARFKLFGEYIENMPTPPTLLLGATTFAASDASYGDPSLVLRSHREGTTMAGWETCRHSYRQRVGITLAQKCIPDLFEVDTYLHYINNEEWVTILGCCNTEGKSDDELTNALPKWKVEVEGKEVLVEDNNLNTAMDQYEKPNHDLKYSMVCEGGLWEVLLDAQRLLPNTLQKFKPTKSKEVTHLMVIAVPDGGIHRVGVFGKNI